MDGEMVRITNFIGESVDWVSAQHSKCRLSEARSHPTFSGLVLPFFLYRSNMGESIVSDRNLVQLQFHAETRTGGWVGLDKPQVFSDPNFTLLSLFHYFWTKSVEPRNQWVVQHQL